MVMVFDSTDQNKIPPPPPLPPTNQPANVTVKELSSCSINEKWEEELQNAFRILNRDERCTGFYVYNHVESIIQRGPTCGLVALVMAARLLNSEVTVVEALRIAREERYSNHGEMFSAKHMKDLSERLMPVEAVLCRDIKSNRSLVIDHLMNGWPLLVPYDSDANHEPTVKGGHRAHWAIILGFCILEPCQDNSAKDIEPLLNKANTNPTINPDKYPDNLLMVLAKQGKSRYIKLWKFDNLCHSNQGLDSINPKIYSSENQLDFVLPEDGNLKESLADQFLMIKPK